MERKRLITAGGTLLCALGIGYFMQSTAPAKPAPQEAAAAAKDATEEKVELEQITLTSAVPTLPKTPEPVVLPSQNVEQAALSGDDVANAPAEQAQPQLACEYDLTAQPEAAAMVRLNLSAPCMTNERFTLHHNGMMITQATDDAGQSEMIVPALNETAVFIVAFANGEGAVANVQVTSLEYYDRAVVQWKGNSGMQIHALEYGADYGSDGHVWADASRDQSSAALGQGGFITRHGASDMDGALVAEVYTFPSGIMTDAGAVALSVEAEVNQANCGRDIEAQSIQKMADGSLQTQDLVLAMPDCNAIGDFLVLKNLLNDLKIAAK